MSTSGSSTTRTGGFCTKRPSWARPPHTYEMVPGSYTVSYEALDGCYVGQTGELQQTVSPATLGIRVVESEMMCANDGVIRVSWIRSTATRTSSITKLRLKTEGPQSKARPPHPLCPKNSRDWKPVLTTSRQPPPFFGDSTDCRTATKQQVQLI